jgi:osmotically-inducible protein OsmY
VTAAGHTTPRPGGTSHAPGQVRRQSTALTGSGNTVTLIGHVRTEAQRDAVVRAAWRGHAVMAVIDQIEITG